MGLQKYFKFSRKTVSGQNTDKENRKWSERIKDVYKLTIRNNESLEVVSQFNLTLLNLYILFSIIFVVVAALIGLLFSQTSILQYVPGADHSASKKDVITLTQKIATLETELQANQTYVAAMKRRVLGEYEYADDKHDTLRVFTKEELNVPKNAAEKKLEAQVANGNFLSDKPEKSTDKQSAPITLKQMQLFSPVIGETSAGFNRTSQHFGIDIIAPKGTPIKSIASGVVIFSDWSMETGNTIIVKHSNDLISVYKHNEKVLKKTGDFIKAGEAIAIIGNTGTKTSGPHLHFELWYKQKPLNPKEFIRFE